MYNSQYYTCEQIDQRLLQGYLDDYNTQTGQSLTKEQFLTKLGNVFAKENIIGNNAANIGYFVCDTANGTPAKVITAAGYELFQGGSIKVKFTNRNTALSATLNINGKGDKALYYGGKPVSNHNSWDNGEVVEIYYDGTSYYANNVEGNFKDGIFDISAYNLTEGQPTKYATLAEALGTNGDNIPPIFRKGGMQIKYVSTSDNKYVQYRLMTQTFSTDEDNWRDDYGYITNELEETNERLDITNRKIGQIPSNFININDENVLLGKYLEYSDGKTEVDYTLWNTTGYIPVNYKISYDLISFRTGVKNNIANGHIYPYDKDFNFIRYYGNYDFGAAQNSTLKDFLIQYPLTNDTRYIRLSFTREDWNTSVFSTYEDIESINSFVHFDNSVITLIQENKANIEEINERIDNKALVDYDKIVKSINRIADGVPYPIQTIEAFKYVVRRYGYKILLCDLMFTSDDVAILSHDHYLNQYYGNVKLIGGGDIPDNTIEENRVYFKNTTYNTLYENYDFGIYKGENFAGIRVQKFEDFVRLCRTLDCDIYVEVKEATESQMLIALDIIRKYRMEERTSWSGSVTHMRAIVDVYKKARVSIMPSSTITTKNVDDVASLKTGENEVFLFGWDSTTLTDDIVSYMIEKNVAFEMGTLNKEQDIIDYFNRNNSQIYCTGIETQTLIAGEVLYNNNIN